MSVSNAQAYNVYFIPASAADRSFSTARNGPLGSRTVRPPATSASDVFEFSSAAIFKSYRHYARGYFDVVLSKRAPGAGNHAEVERKRIFIMRPFAHAGPGRFQLDTAQVNAPAQPVPVFPDPGGFKSGLPAVAAVKLGRYLPGGAVQIDVRVGASRAKPRNDNARKIVMGRNPRFGPGKRPTALIYDGSDPAMGARYGQSLMGVAKWDAARPLHIGVLSTFKERRGRRQETSFPSSIQLGPHQARITDRNTRILLGRIPYQRVLADFSKALRLVPSRDTAYDIARPPAIELSLPANISPSFMASLSLDLVRVGRRGVLELSSNVTGPIPGRGIENGKITVPIRKLDRTGRYEARLYFVDGGERYLLDRIGFDAGGKNPYFQMVSPQPALNGEDVKAVLAGTPMVAGAPLSVTLTHKNGKPVTAANLFAVLFARAHYTYGCAKREGQFVGPRVLLSGGHGLVPAPMEPGPHAIRIFRPLVFPGQPLKSVSVNRGSGKTPFVGDFVELIGEVEFDVTAPAAPGSIKLTTKRPVLHMPIGVKVRRPKQPGPRHSYELQAWRSGDQVPGGALRPPTNKGPRHPNISGFPALFRSTGKTAVAVAAEIKTAALKPIRHPGDYEFRLYDRTTGFYVDRLMFSIRDPGPPGLPPKAYYNSFAATDWPTRDDPHRGLDAWLMPKDACEDPVFPKPPELSVVKVIGDNPYDIAEDRFVPAKDVFPGHPYMVEAKFKQAPADDVYRIKVDGERKIRVFRTRDPKVYRSDVVTFLPGKASPAGKAKPGP